MDNFGHYYSTDMNKKHGSYQNYNLNSKLKNIFVISKFIPTQCCIQNAILKNKSSDNSNVYKLFEAFTAKKTFSILPVVHAKALTEAEKEKFRIRLKQYEATQNEVDVFLATDTWKERLKRLYYKNQEKQASPEMVFMVDLTAKSGGHAYFGTFLFKYIIEKRKFIAEQRAAVHSTNFMAGRKLRDVVIFQSMLFGGKWALRVTGLVGTTLAVSQGIAAYRNKSSVIEYMIGTGTACSLSRFMHGPEGMFSGFMIGSVIGLLIGIPVLYVMKQSHSTQEERNVERIKDAIYHRKRAKGEVTKKTLLEKIPDTSVGQLESKQNNSQPIVENIK